MEPRVENEAIKAIVDDVLEEDVSHKAKRKHGQAPDGKPKKSVRFNDEHVVHEFEVEESVQEEDGPIKEHLLGQAWQKRQLTRDSKNVDTNDTHIDLGSEDAPEEDAEYDHLDGEEVSAFNMKDEEAEGFNPETGELVRRKTEDEEIAQDPWLQSLQHEEKEETQGDDGIMRAKVRRSQVTVDDQTKQRLEAQQAALNSVNPLSEEELAEARSTLIHHMQPRETVMQAVSRLSAKPSQPAPQKAADRVGKRRVSPEEAVRLDLIERFTDAASTLLSSEADIFEQRREELEHAIRMSSILRQPEAQPSDTAAAAGGGSSDDDMFADSDTEATPAAAVAPVATASAVLAGAARASSFAAVPSAAEGSAHSVGAGGHQGAAAQPSAVAATEGGPRPDYSSWPVSELKRVLSEAHVDSSGATEKADLVLKMQELDRQRAKRAVPVGFVLDPASGYFYNPETSWYYHAESGCYYRGGKWYVVDAATGAFQERAA